MTTQNTQSIDTVTSNDINTQEAVMTQSTETNVELSPEQNLIEAFKLHLQSNPMSFSAYTQVVTKILRQEIKPLCTRSQRTQVNAGDDWRLSLKQRFGGRGAKWVFVDSSEIASSLDRFDEMGKDTSDYRAWIEKQGKAWIRFAAPRMHNGEPAAAFTIHLNGSTVPESKTTHLIPLTQLDEVITPMTETPKAMGIEVIVETPAPKEEIIEEASVEEPTNDQDVNDVDEDEIDAF